MTSANTWAKVAVVPLTIVAGLLLLVFSMGRADTMQEFYTGIVTTWMFLATTCAFTAYAWLRLGASRKTALWAALLVWSLVGSAYTAMEVSVMRYRQKTAENNVRRSRQPVEADGAAKGSKPFSSDTNTTSSAAGSRH